MINLLSKENKKYIQQEYRLRLMAFVFKALAILAIAGFLLLIPTYLLTLKRSQTFLIRAEEIRNNPDFQSQETLNELIAKTKEQIALFNNNTPSNISEVVLGPLLAHAQEFQSTIALTGFLYEEKPKQDVLIQVRGNAKSREDLLAFVADLHNEPLFEKLEVPVSDLAKKNDINFALTLELKKKDIYE